MEYSFIENSPDVYVTAAEIYLVQLLVDNP